MKLSHRPRLVRWAIGTPCQSRPWRSCQVSHPGVWPVVLTHPDSVSLARPTALLRWILGPPDRPETGGLIGSFISAGCGRSAMDKEPETKW